ncbi:MAG: hypothetical protein HY017_29510 [Betaproteobacteria bacterium]|nr:hypothetical protein [Betaproteobacteria bacterium]
MSEVDKDLSERYRASARDEPPAQIDAAILAAAQRAVASQPWPVEAPRPLRRWYVPVSLAAVIVLSLVVTLRIQREQPELALPDAPPAAVREKEQKTVEKTPEPRAAPPAEVVLRPAPKSAPAQAAAQPAAPGFAVDPKPRRDAGPPPAAREEIAAESKPIRDAAPAPQASAEAASGRIAENTVELSAAAGARREARAMSAPAPAAPQMALAKRELAPEEWLERIAELRKQGRDKEADEQFADFKRRFPEFRIREPMMERIAPRLAR